MKSKLVSLVEGTHVPPGLGDAGSYALPPDDQLWIADCCLVDNPRMCSQYLLVGSDEAEAEGALMGAGGDHTINRIMPATDPDAKIEIQELLEGGSDEAARDLAQQGWHCLWAGT